MAATVADPFEADFPASLTISANVYIVTAFTDNGAAPVETDFQGVGGEYKGQRVVAGKRTASLTIEVAELDTVTPTALTEITYRGTDWRITQVGRQSQSTGPGSITLSLVAITATEAALIP